MPNRLTVEPVTWVEQDTSSAPQKPLQRAPCSTEVVSRPHGGTRYLVGPPKRPPIIYLEALLSPTQTQTSIAASYNRHLRRSLVVPPRRQLGRTVEQDTSSDSTVCGPPLKTKTSSARSLFHRDGFYATRWNKIPRRPQSLLGEVRLSSTRTQISRAAP